MFSKDLVENTQIHIKEELPNKSYIYKQSILLFANKNAVNAQNCEYVQANSLDDLKGQPFYGGSQNPTQRLSNQVDILLKPLVPI